MKKSFTLNLFPPLVCLLISANFARATVSYWDPEGFRGGYTTYSGPIPLSGIWDTNGWSRNTDGSAGAPADQGKLTSQLQAWTDGDAAVFCVGAGATNNSNQGGVNTTTFTVTVTNTHTISGIF